jgi:hypothetical protein
MNLFDLFNNPKQKLSEGGNLAIGQDQADHINLQVTNRSYIVPILNNLLGAINSGFSKQYKTPLWSPESLQKQTFLSGSSLHFFNVSGISDEQFVAKKPKVGDIDTMVSKEAEPNLEQFLTANKGKTFGPATLIGFQRGNEQFSSLWSLQDPPIKVQIDLEFVEQQSGEPTDWARFSHSSSWDDLQAGVKGVFHKFLIQSFGVLSQKTFLLRKAVGRGKAKAEQDIPTTDNMVSFAVSSKEGGGLRAKYEPVLDDQGLPLVIDGQQVMRALPAQNYEQEIDKIFLTMFGDRIGPKQAKQLSSKFWSFVGLLDVMNELLEPEEKQQVADSFVGKVFGKGAQGLYKGDPKRDASEKTAALTAMFSKLQLQPPADLEQMKQEYMNSYRVTSESINEAEVKAQFRKNMPHLRDLKAIDFLDLIDEINDGNGNFKLQNIPLNVKVDGFGGRFGKNAEGKPFMATSRTEPRYEAGFVSYHQKKGTTDPEILGRAKIFDDLFNEMMAAVKLVDSKLGPEFLVNKQITCEVLFLPFATETSEGKLKFVGIAYDKLPSGVQLALVPFRVVDATSGEDLPEAQDIVKQLTSLGRQGSVMFIDNSLTQQEGLDVTEIINPLDNIEELKQIVSDTTGKRDRASLQLRREVEEKLQPIKLELEKAIINDPNIIGKDILGQDYEGIVINSRLGPIKVTSQEQRKVIADKQAAKSAARAEQPRENQNKTAVVAIGSFVGHIGHEQLWDYTTKKAKELGGDPYLFIGNAQGKDDPIPPNVKVQTWHKMYPQYAKNISTVTQEGGSLMQKIKHELINPLPGKPPRYDNIVIMVGEDQANMNIANALMKAVTKFQGYEHVKVSLEATPRGTGMSFTKLRNILKDPNATEQQQLAVWSQGFDVNKLGADWIKHLMDITRQGMGIKNTQQTPQPQPAPVVAERLFNALMRPNKEINESTSIDSALKIVVNDIGEPITAVYDKLKFMAKRYVHDHGELNRGWKMVEMGEGARWVQGMYNAQLKGALFALTKYNPKRTRDLQQFLAGREVKGEIELKRSFNNISNELPEILAKVGNYIESPELTKASRRWMQNKTEYENYIDSLGDNEDDYGTPTTKPEKNKLPGQQKAQADQIVNDILKRLPSKVAGDIRNAIARSPNKLQALQLELQNRGVKAPMAESLIEAARMSAAVKLQRAFDRERSKSDASRQRADRAKAEFEKEWKAKQEKEKGVAEGWKSKVAGAAMAAASLIGNPAHAGDDNANAGWRNLPDIVAHITMNVNGKTIEKEINLGTEYPSPMAAKLAVAKWLKEKGITNYSITLERVKSEVKEGDARYKVKSIGRDSKGDYYVSPNTGKKVYKQAKVGDHETPSGEHKPKVQMPYKEDQRLDPKCWKGYRKSGTKMKGGTRVNNCVPIGEHWEQHVAEAIKLLESK